ncbi:hypothetical protein GCM10009613_52260 [Pseudonocardia kongjuensis]|uniref:Uncharacterized protein n=2 Tax=Pseudonocardia kongjuensis TaxID=102227 RepID=A0ABP4IT04_9PSEU
MGWMWALLAIVVVLAVVGLLVVRARSNGGPVPEAPGSPPEQPPGLFDAPTPAGPDADRALRDGGSDDHRATLDVPRPRSGEEEVEPAGRHALPDDVEPEPLPEPVLPEQAGPPEPLVPARPPRAARPAEPSRPAGPAQPVQSAEPVQSAQPSQPVQSARPVQSAEPVHPIQPVQSAEPSRPAQPVQSAEPSRPAQPVQPVQPPSTGGSALAALDSRLIGPAAASAPLPEGVRPGPYLGSVLAPEDGSEPPDTHRVKVHSGSRRFHTTDSPYYVRTRADLYFESESGARAAGFIAWHERPGAR